ncbi:MAG: DnaJ domain-containing protein [Polyangiales bacterium]
MASASRPHPSAEGRFGKTPFAHVLLYIREHGLSGTLSIDGPAGGALAGEHFFVFENGSLAQTWIATGIDRLGDILVETKVIPNAARKDAEVVHNATKQLIGDVFVEMNLCDAAAIARGLAEQNRRRAVRIFALGDAAYRFYQDSDLLEGFGRERFSVDVLAIVWLGVQASPPNATIGAVLNRVGAQSIRLKPNALLDAFGFSDDVQHILDVLRLGPATIKDLESFSTDAQVARSLAYVLLTSKQAEVSAAPPAALAPQPAPRASQPPLAPVGSAPTTPAVSAAPAAVATHTQSSGPAPSSDPKAREAEVLLASMDEQTYYEMLGVAKNASMDEIRGSFMKMAAKWHPDRAPTAAAKEAYQRVFAMVNEAHQTLSDETARGRYNRIAQDGGGTPAAQRKVLAMLEASSLAQKADIHHRRREFAEAEKLARQAAEMHRDDPAVVTVLGAVLLEKTDAASLDEAIVALTEAVTLAPKNDRAQVLIANAFKRKGDNAKSLEHFRLALEANPKNIDAAREVRLADMRAKNAPAQSAKKDESAEAKPADKSTAGGIFSKLFKR